MIVIKKIVSLITLVVLLFFTYAYNVSAESLDFSKLSNDELINILTELNDEIIKRGLIRKVRLPAGQYEAGVDIPVGTYILTAVTINDKSYPCVEVYKDKTDATAILGVPIYREVLPDNGECTVKLEAGNVLVLQSVTFTIERFNISSL